jgi:hypothetical protein
MITRKHVPATLAFIVSLAAASTLMAQGPADVDAVTTTPALHVQQWGNVQYLNGGAGMQERAAMRSLDADFPLQILFSGKAGEYGVARQVRVYNGGTQVAAVDNAGPLVMFKLPPGRYTVDADFGSRVERKTVSVGESGQLLHWASAAVSQN